MTPPNISICIPTYRKPGNLRRLLLSIENQTYLDYEVIITDDSPDRTVYEVCCEFPELNLHYFKNDPAVGTPGNWNRGISLATGEWIKIMHDDDWFRKEDALQSFIEAATDGIKFISSQYVNVIHDGGEEYPKFSKLWQRRIYRVPMTLLARNAIGPPSVTLIHKSICENYDVQLKWRVDIDYYIRLLSKKHKRCLIMDRLINVGVSATQVTNECLNVPEVELPEGLILLEKFGVTSLKNIFVYDAYWRIIRNVKVRTIQGLKAFTPTKEWPAVIKKMVRIQARIPFSIIRVGVISKVLMLGSFILSRTYLRKN